MTSILIIDDDPMIRNLLSQFFALGGYTTAGAENGKEFFKRFEGNPNHTKNHIDPGFIFRRNPPGYQNNQHRPKVLMALKEACFDQL